MPFDKDLRDLIIAAKRMARSPSAAIEQIKANEVLGSYRCYGLRGGKIRWVEELMDTPLRRAIEMGRQVAIQREADRFEIWDRKDQLYVEPLRSKLGHASQGPAV